MPSREAFIFAGVLGAVAFAVTFAAINLSSSDNPRVVQSGPFSRSIAVKFAICEKDSSGGQLLRCKRCSLESDCPEDAWVVMMREVDVKE